MGEQAACWRRVFGKFCLYHPHPDADICLWRCRPLPVKLRRARSSDPGAGRLAPRVAQPRRSGAQGVIFGVPRRRARGTPALPLPGRGGGPFPGREPLGGAGDIFLGLAMLVRWHFWGGGCLGSKVSVPGARAQSRGRRWRARSAPGARGRTGPTFSRSLPAAVPRCRKRRRVLTCALILPAARRRGEIRRGPRAALARTHAAGGPGSGVPSGGDEPPPLLSQPAPLQTLLPGPLPSPPVQ